MFSYDLHMVTCARSFTVGALALALASCASAALDAGAARPSVASEIGPCGSLMGDGAPDHYFAVAYRQEPEGPPALALTDGPFSVEFWFRLEGREQRGFVGTRGPGGDGWRLGVSTAGVSGTVFGGFDHVLSLSLSDGRWHHLAWTYDGQESVLYVDGRARGREAYRVAVRPSEQPVVMAGVHNRAGTRADGAAGLIDEVRVSSVIRYRAPFAPARRHGVDAQAIGLWHFDPAAPSRDASARAHPGRITGALLSREDAAPFCER